MFMRRCLVVMAFLSITLLMIVGCGSDSSDGPTPPPPQDYKDYLDSSYELQKTRLHVSNQGIRTVNPGTFVLAIGYADFNSDGYEDVFIASGDGSTNRIPVEMYLNNGWDSFVYDASLFDGALPGLVHPRKALIGDYNGDTFPDIFVLGHGYDRPPFPGEYPVLLLSSASGLLSTIEFQSLVGFNHGGASADIDEDGDIDIYIGGQPFIMVNDGTGNFTYDTQLVPDELNGLPLFTAELIYVDVDGYYDLLVAGHEHEGMPTTIYWGSTTGAYTALDKTVLPSVFGQGTVVDIDADDIDNDGDKDIVLTRTGGGQNNFYVGYYFQVIANSGSRLFVDETSTRFPSGTGSDWICWIRLQDTNDDGYLDIIIDDADRDLIWLNDGSGSFQ